MMNMKMNKKLRKNRSFFMHARISAEVSVFFSYADFIIYSKKIKTLSSFAVWEEIWGNYSPLLF